MSILKRLILSFQQEELTNFDYCEEYLISTSIKASKFYWTPDDIRIKKDFKISSMAWDSFSKSRSIQARFKVIQLFYA